MLKKLAFASALVNDSKVLLLDEPTAGLGPNSRKTVRKVLRELVQQGKTIVLSSHELWEVKKLSTCVLSRVYEYLLAFLLFFLVISECLLPFYYYLSRALVRLLFFFFLKPLPKQKIRIIRIHVIIIRTIHFLNEELTKKPSMSENLAIIDIFISLNLFLCEQQDIFCFLCIHLLHHTFFKHGSTLPRVLLVKSVNAACRRVSISLCSGQITSFVYARTYNVLDLMVWR